MGEASAKAVVATDTASLDADYDNGAIFHGAPRYEGDDELAAHRIDTARGTRKARSETCNRATVSWES